MSQRTILLSTVCLVWLGTGFVRAADVDFARDIKPILATGLSVPTMRDRVLATLSSGTNRWSLIGSTGWARNRRLGDNDAVGPGTNATPTIDSFTACGGGALRMTRAVALVGSLLYARQLAGQVGNDFLINTYRIALGIRLQLNAWPITSPRSREVLDPTNLGRNARATC